jgi:hypothetical protein
MLRRRVYSSCWLKERERRLAAKQGGGRMTDPHCTDLDLDLSDCPTELIGAAWDVTTLMLDRLDPEQQARLSRIRKAYLDEIECRQPTQFIRWLLDSATAETVGQPVLDWIWWQCRDHAATSAAGLPRTEQ